MWSKAIPVLLVSGGLVSGCASLSQQAGLTEVAQTVETRTGLPLQSYAGAPSAKTVDTIQQWLREDLSVDRAVRMALLNNRSLQATLQDIGIASAEAREAVLIPNPVFSGHARVPDAGQTNIELALAENVLDVLLTPLRQRVAQAEFEAAKLRVAHDVLQLIADVKTASYTAQAAQETFILRQTVLQAAEAAATLAQRQYEAGNLRDFDLWNEQAAFHQAHLDLTRAELELKASRETLNQLLGFSGVEATTWRMATPLAELPAHDPALEHLEELALSQRLDMAAARKEVESFGKSLTLASLGFIPSGSAAINTEKDPDGSRVTGPAWDIGIPILNWGQAQRARAKAKRRQAEHRLAALEVAVRSQVRSAYAQLSTQREIAQRYQTTLIPLRQQIITSTQKHYNYMLLGVFQLLMVKQQAVSAQREYLEALRDYWIARADVEQAVGGRLPEPEASSSPTPPAKETPRQPKAAPAPEDIQDMPGMQHHQHGGGS